MNMKLTLFLGEIMSITNIVVLCLKEVLHLFLVIQQNTVFVTRSGPAHGERPGAV